MRNRKASPIHQHRKATFILYQLTPVKYYMEDELLKEDLSAQLIDCTVEEFFELFKLHNKNFFKYGTFNGLYFYTTGFSSMFLLFNDSFYETYKEGCYYALPSSIAELSSFLVKEHYPNETEYLKTAAYINNVTSYKPGSFLLEFRF